MNSLIHSPQSTIHNGKLDTRTKIVSLEAAAESARRERAAGRRITLVTGWFDPVVAPHARRLTELAGDGAGLFVAVTDPVEPVLPARARAELVAAQRVVQHVILSGDGGLPAIEAALQPDSIIHEERSDTQRVRELIRHVQSRQTAR